MAFEIADLVESEDAFFGVGKIVSLDENSGSAVVAFFESPMQCHARKLTIKLSHLLPAVIFDETSIYLFDSTTGIWRRARYGSRRPDGSHLVIFSRDDTAVVPVAEIYVLNLAENSALSPLEYLEARCCDTPYFAEWRLPFFRSYIEQRAACKSISSILSSSVEIEPHQIAVVRRVLEDRVRKYLLADEVGLGKTIEACLIIREHVLQDESDALVIVSVPMGLIGQWRDELTERFYLGDLLDQRIFVCTHEKLAGAIERAAPTMIVIDEAHQITPWAWSDDETLRFGFQSIAAGTSDADSCLLLSGTPLTGNEESFLAMLHLLTPESYQLTSAGIKAFKQRLEARERLGGMYQALVPSNDNDSLTDIVAQTVELFPNDLTLESLAGELRPLIYWNASSSGEERAHAIRQVRQYLGENYRLHQRMLRNRREDSAIAGLFPGLSGASYCHWEVDERSLSIDQLFDSYRDEHLRSPNEPSTLNACNFIDWMELYLNSPILVSRHAKHLLEADDGRLPPHEVEFLGELVHCGQVEQLAKDRELDDFLPQWLRGHPRGKVVVFCGEVGQADGVYERLRLLIGDSVERHIPPETPQFQRNAKIRVLVCDSKGEDGLNLHGGEKLIVHYSVPLSFSRIEQRNGRANRYSAGLHARPVASLVLVPGREAFFHHWVALLDEAVGIFGRSVASLQYVLQAELDTMKARAAKDGLRPVLEMRNALIGAAGILERERQKVNAQEQLDSMNEEVENAKTFAAELLLADENAEAQSSQMLYWICRALQFVKTPADIPGAFRLRYSTGGSRGPRTLVDVQSFVAKCVTGIDREESDWSAPVTSLMSPDRQLVTHGRQVYPMRFGQPFVDTIYELSRIDSRGICSAWLRACASRRIDEPKIYFCLTWLVDGCPDGGTALERRLADELIAPRVYSQWLDARAETVVSEWELDLLTEPYSKEQRSTKRDVAYQDVRVRHDTWGTLEQYLPLGEWGKLVHRVHDASLSSATSIVQPIGAASACAAIVHLEAISVVILLRSEN